MNRTFGFLFREETGSKVGFAGASAGGAIGFAAVIVLEATGRFFAEEIVLRVSGFERSAELPPTRTRYFPLGSTPVSYTHLTLPTKA